MKINELTKLRTKEVTELEKLVEDKKQKVVEVVAKRTVGKENNLKVARNIRKDISQLLTIISEKKLVKNK